MLGLVDGDVLLHASMWETSTFGEAVTNVSRYLKDWETNALCEELIIALGPDGGNYRDDIFSDYKQTTMRKKGRVERPSHLLEVKRYIEQLSNCVVGGNIEADDLLGHWSNQLEHKAVIITVDKDLDQIYGPHFNFRKQSFYFVEETQANLFFLKQLVMGDPMDNIPGLPQWGPVKAEKLLAGSPGEEAEAVIQAYKLVYQDNWLEYFLSNGKLLFIQRQPNDWFTLDRYKELFY